MRIPLIERVAGKPIDRTAAFVVSRGVHYHEKLPFHPLDQVAPQWLKDICGQKFEKLLVEGPHVPLKRSPNDVSINLIVLCDCGRYELRSRGAMECASQPTSPKTSRMCFYCACGVKPLSQQ